MTRFLSGAINADTRFAKADLRNNLPRFTPEARTANQAVVDLVRDFAIEKGATPAQIALA